jgi:prepilin-type N-terminal cleavage/methylation domain-containing protein
MARPLQSLPFVAKRHPRGFTLIEMMIVVVIVGVLAMLAVVGFRKLVQSSHVSEATNMVQNIRVAQEAGSPSARHPDGVGRRVQ